MKFIHQKSSEIEVKYWNGGTTTQLTIFPEGSDYLKRNFNFRISTASIEINESEFTILPEIKRKLMVLEGEIELIHAGQYRKKLKKFEQDEFSGEWHTKCVGKAIDFNLMTRGLTHGEIKAFKIQEKACLEFEVPEDIHFVGIYLFNGDIEIQAKDETISSEKGDFIQIFTSNILTIKFFANTNTEVVVTLISN